MKTGRVYLIGAGPGDPELITVKGLRLLERADVILCDGLANPALLRHARPDCDVIDVEKRPGFQRVQQDEINQLMVAHARQGRCVVRLKGGDPIVFGRGGEEAEVLRDAGIPFEIVPGITSAIAAPAYAGVPVTHRGVSTHVTIATGTTAALSGPGSVDWEMLARAGGTLLILMGTQHRADIAMRLMAGGRSAETPVTAVQNGTLPHQKTVRTTLGQLGNADVGNPAVIVVGAVAAMDVSWFESRPLFGRTVMVTRARTQASSLSEVLSGLGAVVLEAPTLEIAPPERWAAVDAAIRDIDAYDWVVLTSPNGADRFFQRLFDTGRDVRALKGVQIASIGPATTERVAARFLQVDLEPENHTSEGLLAAFERLGQVSGKRFLLLRPETARDVLPKGLHGMGGRAEEVAVYRTVPPAQLPADVLSAIDADGVDLVAFTSSSTVRNLAALLEGDRLERLRTRVPVACIGPITTETALENGFRVVAQSASDDVSIAGLASAIERFFQK